MTTGIPLHIIEKLFADCSLHYIDDARIPSPLKAEGWESRTYQKQTSDGYAVVHVIFGPNESGEPVCLSDQRLAVVVGQVTTEDGRTVNQIMSVEPVATEPDPRCIDLLASIHRESQ